LGTNRLEIEASDKMLAELLEMTAEIKSGSASAAALDETTKERCLAVLRAGLAGDEFWPAMHAAEALTIAGHQDEVLDALAKRAAADDQQGCGLAREALRAGDKSKVEVLLTILVKPNSNGHTHAAESLFKVHQTGDGQGLRAALAQNENLKLKLMAAAALARGGDKQALNIVRKYVTHDDRDTRMIAAWILGQIGSADDIGPLRKALVAEEGVLAKAYIAHALACRGDAEGRKLLGENLKSADAAVRTYAADFAGQARTGEHRDQLVKLLDDGTLDVRVRSAQALLMMNQPRPR
jgi:sialidase-1